MASCQCIKAPCHCAGGPDMFNSSTGNYESLADTGYTASQIDDFFNDLARTTGASYQAGDRESLIAKLVGGSGYITALNGDPRKAFGEFVEQYQRRGSNVPLVTPSSEYLNVGTTGSALVKIASAGPQPKSQAARTSVPGAPGVLTPPPVLSLITTQGASLGSGDPVTVGPTGLAYPDDPVHYGTGDVSPAYGTTGLQSGNYNTGAGLSGLLTPSSAPGADNTGVYLLYAGIALAAYFLIVK